MKDETMRDNLIKSIEAGLSAETAKKFLLDPIHKRRNQLHERMESSQISDNQNIDNSALLVIHFELRVLRRIETAFSEAIAEGEEARKRLQELNKPDNQRVSSLRF